MHGGQQLRGGMTSDPPSRRRPLTAEEAELWQHAMRQAKALRRREREEQKATERVAKAADATSGEGSGVAAPGRGVEGADEARRKTEGKAGARAVTDAPRVLPPGGRRPVVGGAAGGAGVPGGATGRTPVNSPPPLAQFDDRQRRKLAKDADLIEARLDLHGMRQVEAHGALRAFLRSSAARGVRHALVITGKGAPEGHLRDYMQGEGRGVLRRLVPLWLGEPELRGVVVSYTAAHARHGGEGALYVRLRKALPPR